MKPELIFDWLLRLVNSLGIVAMVTLLWKIGKTMGTWETTLKFTSQQTKETKSEVAALSKLVYELFGMFKKK